MGNQHSAAHTALKPRKNVHWKSAGRPAPPGKPDIIPILTDEEPNAITLRWAPAVHDGGAPLQGYQVECNRLGSPDWIRTAPPIVLRPELVLTGLEPPHRYQFRVAALNAVGRSEYSELSDVLTVSFERGAQEAPIFLQHVDDVTALENDKTEFRVTFTGAPTPTIAWFKDDYEIFSSRRTAITTTESSSVLIFHQTLASDEGEIKCTATNRAGHAVTKARLALEAAPKLRYPRQYEDGLLYEINETVYLKTTIVGKPAPTVEWLHDGQSIVVDDRVEITNTPKFSVLKIHSARRSDRGEYQVHARNNIGEDTAAFLVTITAPPDAPKRVSVTRQVDKSVTLDWEPPEDDGGCRIGNYVVEYYRTGWNVWLKATTSRKTNVTLFDLIEGSEYRFRVKAESPYGMSAPSAESATVKIPGRAVDVEFLAVESRIINDALTKEEGVVTRVSPVPRRKRANTAPEAAPPARVPRTEYKDPAGSNEFMLVLYPDKADDKAEKRKSFQLDLEDALSPPPISLSAPELSSRCIMPFKALRNAVSSTELLHERAMARFYKAVQMKEEQSKHKDDKPSKIDINTDIPYNNHDKTNDIIETTKPVITPTTKTPEIYIKTDSIENRQYKYNSRQASHDSETSDSRWQQNSMSFDEDYTASTVSTDGENSEEEGSLNGELDIRSQYSNEEDTYHPRDKTARRSPSYIKEEIEEEEESEREIVKPLPLPDPNFVPKPILKRRDLDQPESKLPQHTGTANYINSMEEKVKPEEKPKKEEKVSMFKKFTKMPVQKPFQFPKILSKKEPEKQKEEVNVSNNASKKPNNVETIQDKVTDEGRTVIDYYTNIVKEYGSQKKSSTTLYTTTEDLKTVAEKQEKTESLKIPVTGGKRIVKQRKTQANNSSANKAAKTKPKQANSIDKTNLNKKPGSEKSKIIKKANSTPKAQDNQNVLHESNKKYTQQIVLKKTERATIVIPIDYQELEEKAKVTVRSAIDYTVDMCLLLLAFWVYFFKDERLAIPFLILIIYRQLQETFLMNIPEWVRRHTPNWIKKKTS
ncbi:titin [Plodia interpunctella]|uniref:titin n=1 Tax=Plodia interpunctella TaxID=58824 RepID=UPI002368DFEE|nr:titin [Plodia interpunctella]